MVLNEVVLNEYLKTYLTTDKYLVKSADFIVKGLICLSLIAHTGLASAQGVLAGTSINNIATVSYSTGSIAQGAIESSPSGNSAVGAGNGTVTMFVVDRKVDLLVTGNTNANVTPGDSQVQVTFSLQNQGNAIQEMALSSDSTLTSDDFNIDNCNVEVIAVSGVALPGVVLPTTTNIRLSPDQLATVSIRCNVPLSNAGAPINSGETASVELLAHVVKNQDGSLTTASNSSTATGLETVFTDGAGSAENVTDVLRDASHSAIRDYIAENSSATPELTMNKTIVSVTAPDSSDQAITGSEVIYKIQISTTGIGNIENVLISDPTPLGMTYKANSIQLNSSNQTDISDAADNTDFGITTVDTATINLGNLTAGSQQEILLSYIVN